MTSFGTKNKTKMLVMLVLLVGVFCIASLWSREETEPVVASEVSNKTIAWGVKREKDHKQPDLGTQNRKILEANDGICMGNAEEKVVYLTFDEGYEAGYTDKILEVLKANNVKATFFVTAHYVNSRPELVKQMIEEGHIVGNHTVNHKSMPTLSEEQIKTEVMNLHTAVYEKFGYEMKYIRPPKGEFSEKTLQETGKLGYTTVLWSLAYDDWDENHQKGKEYAKTKIIENIHPGAIILLHGNSKDNANVLDFCIKEIRNMGYEFKSLDEFKK